MSDCNAVQCSDQMTCSCGNVWDMNDPYPPECKTELAMLAVAPAVQVEPSYKEMYKEFSEWCQNNRGFDLDCRLHTHGGPIDRGGYISNEKTRVAFAAYRAGRLLAPQLVEQQSDAAQLVEALESLMKGYASLLEGGIDRITHLDGNCYLISDMLRGARAALAAHRKQGGEL